MNLQNSYLDCTCGYCMLGRTIQQELIAEIKKFKCEQCEIGDNTWFQHLISIKDLIGDNKE